MAAAPKMTVTSIEVGDATPVLAFSGSIVDEGKGYDNVGFRVAVKNLSTGKVVTTVTTNEDSLQSTSIGYRLAVVDIKSGRAAQVGDVLEASAESSHPLIRVQPLRYTVTVEDVRKSRILLPELVAYEIPTETALLLNYPALQS